MVRNAVEERPDVEPGHPVELSPALARDGERIVRPAAGPVPVAVRVEELLRRGPDPVRGHGLRNAIGDHRHPERPGAAPGLGGFEPP